MTLPQKLKHLRKQKGLSMSDLNLRTGLSKCIISKYEAGKCDIHVGTLVKWCGGLSIKTRDIFDEK